MAGVLFDQIVEKLNPYHGKDGRFTTAGAAASFTYKPGASTAHDKAIEREKERNGARSFQGRLFHGSPATDIEDFDMDRAGRNTNSGEKLLFFTDSRQMADDFSYERLEGSTTFMQRRGKKGRVYEVDVEMKNALDLRNLSDSDIDNLLKLDPDGILTREIARDLSGRNNQQLKTYLDLSAESLSALGYDGLIANAGKAGHNGVEYAVVSSQQAKIVKSVAKSFNEIIEKFNPYHDAKGRFATSGSYASFTYSPGKSKAHDLAIQRQKERMASIMPSEAQTKTLKGIENRTRNLKKEQFRVVDREGNVIMEKQGDKHSVNFSVGEARDNFPGNITIHNHPDGGTFSTPDLSAIGYGATEIRAASPEGTYILRNMRYKGKYDAAKEKTWYDMREDLDAAAEDFKTHRSLKSEIRKPFDAETEALAAHWASRKQAGADQAELDRIYGEYTAKVESFRPQIEVAARKAYVDQYHHWYKENAGKYGMEYEFIPVQTRTRKSDMEFDLIETIGKGDGEEIVLDRKMNQDAQELADAILAEMLADFPGAGVAKTFNEILSDLDVDQEIEEVVKTWTDLDGIYEETIEKSGGNPYHDPKTGRFTSGPGGSSMIRQGPPPKKTKTAYKVFVARNGKLYPPMVANPDGQATPVGVWLDASPGKLATDKDGNPITNTLGRNKVVAGGKGTQGGSGTLAYRPGWHLGEVPEARQFYTKDKVTGEKKQKKNFVWAECDIAADFDYQEEAMSYGYNKNGKFQHSLAGLPKMPTDGYYKYRTNPDPNTQDWYITGSMRVRRILTDAETNKILRDHGIEPMRRDGGELDLKALGFAEREFVTKGMEEVNKWDPSQPRDKWGKWTSGGGGMFGMKPTMPKPTMPRPAAPKPAAAPPSPSQTDSGTGKPQMGQLRRKINEDVSRGKYPDMETAQKAYIREMTGQSDAEAERTLREMHRYTGEDWRNADVKILDKYIDQDHAYHARDGISRGMAFDDAGYQKFTQNIKPGALIGMKGVSSWSSEVSAAMSFAESGDPSKNSVILKCVFNRTASPIAHLSEWKGENEVLAKSTTRWKVLDVKERTKNNSSSKEMIITVEEVE